MRKTVIAIVALVCWLVAATTTIAASPGPSWLLTGFILGADHEPTTISVAKMGEQDGATRIYDSAISVAADGSFSVPLVPAGTSDHPVTVTLLAWGAPLPPEHIGDCLYVRAPAGSLDISLTGAPPNPVTLTLGAPGYFSGVCSASVTSPTSAPPPASVTTHAITPRPSLPPTDTDATVVRRIDKQAPAWLAVVLLAVLGPLAIRPLRGRRAPAAPLGR